MACLKSHFSLLGVSILVFTLFANGFSLIRKAVSTDQANTAYYLQLYNVINNYRTKHVAPAVKWNRNMNEAAEYLAYKLLESPGKVDPDDLQGIIYYETPGSVRPSAETTVSAWYSESSNYDYNKGAYNSNTLNFTQLVWKSSVNVGLGTSTFRNMTIVLAQFEPRGNIRGKFKQNVIPIRTTKGWVF